MESTRTFTADELKDFNGGGADGKIFISVLGNVYDVTAGAAFYGPGSGYHVFAGKEASRALAKMQISDEEANAGWDNLNEEHVQTLADWEKKYKEKYPVVGTFAPDRAFVARGLQFEP